MKIENQVVSLELSKRLKKLGFKQESLFYWCYFGKSKSRGEDYRLLTRGQFSDNELIVDWFSAYTVAELGEMLPRLIGSWKSISCFNCWVDRDADLDLSGNAKDRIPGMMADTEADARAKMLIYLKENNLI